MVVRVGFFRIFSQRFDVCQMAKDYDVELSVRFLPVTTSLLTPCCCQERFHQVRPEFYYLISAKFNVHTTGRTQDGKPLTCLNFLVSFFPSK